jgi:hypothetical protein
MSCSNRSNRSGVGEAEKPGQFDVDVHGETPVREVLLSHFDRFPRPLPLTDGPAMCIVDARESLNYPGNAKSDRLDTVVARAPYSAPVSGDLATS